jgi:ABC-2 type transport system permease protein
MLKALLAFELRQQFSNPVLWIVAAAFALLGFGAASSEAVQVGGAIGNVNRNAPTVILTLLNGFSEVSMLLVTIFIAGAALRDFDNRTAELFFTTPVAKRDYLMGRFGGGFVAAFAVMAACALGMFAGYFMPWVDAARIGSHSLMPWLWGFGVVVLPNLLFVGALLFCIAVATRSMLATYIGVIAFFALTVVTGTLTADLDTRWIGALLDPFGGKAISDHVRYWSVSERNLGVPSIDGVLLMNRFLWLAVTAGLLGLAYRLFRTDREGLRLWHRRAGQVAAAVVTGVPPTADEAGEEIGLRKAVGPQGSGIAVVTLPRVSLRTDAAAQFRQFLHQAWFDSRGVLTGVPLLVMLLIGVFILVINMMFGNQMFGTTVYPTTPLMTQQIAGSMSLFLIIIVTFYAGELVWRERSQRIAEVTDAFPTADWVPLAGKLVALTTVVFAFYSVGIVIAIGNQLIRGYTDIELALYLQQMLLNCTGFVLVGVLALTLQVIANNKFIGYLAMLVYLISRVVLGLLDFDDNLYRPFGAPGTPYSAMNGFGHFLVGHLWFRAYWGAFAGILLVLAMLLWVRGRRSSLRERLADARQRLRPGTATALAVLVLGFIATGVFIHHNTHRLNTYLPGDAQKDLQARYEREWRDTRDRPQPRITVMRTEVDLFPDARRLAIRGHYRLVNRNEQAVDVLHVELPTEAELVSLDIGAHVVDRRDEALGITLYRLDTPLAPGAEMDFDFELLYAPRGFRNDAGPTQLVYNGSFFNNSLLPAFGYNANRQLVNRNDRRKQSLPELPRMPSIDDEAARANTYLSDDADWLDFETIVSTSTDQIALAPGYLQREWTEGDRRYFHYTMDVPMLPFAAWLSARWDVRRGEWKGLPIEVYYHPPHHYNVDRMIEASQKALDYFDTAFTPYQHKQLRILEFPGYQSFAQAFANTVPYSESIGFVADLRDREKVDYVFYVTAHEVAHQWWAHQVIGANVQGSTMLSESLSQYSALMVMEKEYGPHQMRRFLKYELDRYLSSRAGELVEELPLSLVENQQYIHYNKGSLVFYALRDAIGEDALNAILKRFLEDKQYQQPPYTTSREFLTYLYEGTDPVHHRLIEDLFEKIVFFDNRTTEARAVRRDDGRYAVTLDLHSAKYEAQGKGEETEVALDDEIDIGIFARPKGGKESDETVLYLQKHRISAGATTLEIVVDEAPFDAGIDPYNKLIDRVSDDNRRRVTL